MTSQQSLPWVSEHFPFEIRQRLVRAAATEDPEQRVREIDAAVDWARTHYPELFRWRA